MLVRFLKHLATPSGSYRRGIEHEIPDAKADNYLRAGLVERVTSPNMEGEDGENELIGETDPSSDDVEELEFATLHAPETAVTRGGRKNGGRKKTK